MRFSILIFIFFAIAFGYNAQSDWSNVKVLGILLALKK